MAAGVHLAGHARSIGPIGRLVDRQRVHVGAQADQIAAATGPQHPDHAGLGQPRVHLVEAKAAQLVSDEGGRSHFLETEFGMRVQIPTPSRHLALKVADPVDDRHGSRPYRLD